jgi:hypothetical protein
VANEFPEAPEEDVYNQIIELINQYISEGGGEVSEEAVVEIIEKYFEENPIPKEVQNITSIDTVYDTVDDLPTDKGEGTTLLVLSEKSLYSYNSTANAWEFNHALKPHTVYCVLEGEKAGLYRFTMASPYLVSIESHTLQEAKDYTDEAIQKYHEEHPVKDGLTPSITSEWYSDGQGGGSYEVFVNYPDGQKYSIGELKNGKDYVLTKADKNEIADTVRADLADIIGDIDTALDELHTYAQSLAGGATV